MQNCTCSHRSQQEPEQATGLKIFVCFKHCIEILQAVTASGQPRYRSECDRGGLKWHSREILVDKDTSWMDEIACSAIQV